MKFRVMPVTAILLAILAATALSLWYRSTPKSRYWQKMVILGFDGMDPDLVEQLVRGGKLPNIKRLIDQGGLYSLGTTHSAESPTAWASFATGVAALVSIAHDESVTERAARRHRNRARRRAGCGKGSGSPGWVLRQRVVLSPPRVSRAGTSARQFRRPAGPTW